MMDKTLLVTLSNPGAPAAEAYRALWVNLAYASLDHELRTLVVSAPAADPDKSVVAANLAIAIAQAGEKVILVDADLRRPHLHRMFDMMQSPGLTEWARSRDERAPLVESGVPGLRLLPSGELPPNPADILGSQRMALMVKVLLSQCAVVVLDTPPVTVGLDAAVLGSRCDGLLLTMRAGRSRRESVKQAQARLEEHQVRLLGAVLTEATGGGLITGY